MPKGRLGNTRQRIREGGDKAEKAGGITHKCRQQGAVGVNSDPRLVLKAWGVMLCWGKDCIDIC